MKLESDIKQDLFNYVKTTLLFGNVNGELLKTDRTANASNEDIEISLLTEPNFNDVQEVVVLIRVYVQDFFKRESNEYVANEKRIAELERLSFEAFESFRTNEARCYLQSQKTFKAQEKNEHCVVNRVSYNYCQR